MSTKFEQARGRPKPPPVNTQRHGKYQQRHNLWAIVRATNGAWITFEPRTERFTKHQSWEQAIQWVGEQVKRG